jgi:hypothetical protein
VKRLTFKQSAGILATGLALVSAFGFGSAAAAGSSASGTPPIASRPLRPPCRNAYAELADRPGIVTVVARCVARHGHKFSFGVSGWGGQILRGLDLRPSTSGTGAISPRGRCGWYRPVIYCSARARGSVVLRAHFRLATGAGCAHRLSITQVVPDSCQLKPGGPCPASEEIQQLFAGLPRGC